MTGSRGEAMKTTPKESAVTSMRSVKGVGMARKVTSEHFPEEWQAALDTLTGSSSSFRLGIRAARYIENIRLRTGVAPTFAELFTYLWPEHGGVPGPVPNGLTAAQRGKVRAGFRAAVSSRLTWLGWLCATAKPRSLRPGPRFHTPSSKPTMPPNRGNSSPE